MAKFADNYVKNTNIGYILFKLNCGFQSRASYKKDVDSRSNSKAVDELDLELNQLTAVCKENVKHCQKLQKCHHDTYAKLKSNALSKKVSLNSKYI